MTAKVRTLYLNVVPPVTKLQTSPEHESSRTIRVTRRHHVAMQTK